MRSFFIACLTLLASFIFMPTQEAKAQLSLDIQAKKTSKHYGLKHYQRPRSAFDPRYARDYLPHYRPLFRPAPVIPLFAGPLSFGQTQIKSCVRATSGRVTCN